MEPILGLLDEHPTLLKTLKALEVYARGHWVRPDDLAKFVAFFREFVELRSAQEDLLFDALVERGFGRDSGPIGNLLAHREERRHLLSRLALLSCNVGARTESERRAVADTAREYARLLKSHLRKQEGLLFPLARVSLHQHDLTELGRALQNLDTLRRGRTGRERLERLAEELTARYPDATNAESAMTGSFGAGRTGSPDERVTGIER